MTWLNPFLITALTGVGLMAIAAALAGLLRSARLPGGAPAAGVVGGLLAGTLLGLTVLGRVAPDLGDRLYLGVGAERAALTEMQRRHATELLALRDLDVTPVAVEDHAAMQARKIAPLRAAVEAAEQKNARVWALTLALVGSAWLLSAGLSSARARRARSAAEAAPRAVIAGLLACFLAGAAVFLLSRWTMRTGVTEAAAFACAMAAFGPGASSAAHRLLRSASARRSAGLAAGAALVAALIGIAVLAPGWPTGALLGAGVGAVVIRARLPLRRGGRRAARRLASGALAPGAVAIAAAHADFIGTATQSRFWIALVIAVILTADARWIGGWAGWNSVGTTGQRGTAWSRSAVMLAGGVGAAQALIAGMAFLSGVLPAAALAALVLAAPTIDLPCRLRGRLSAALDHHQPIQPSE